MYVTVLQRFLAVWTAIIRVNEVVEAKVSTSELISNH
jgi:hypothetical protein